MKVTDRAKNRIINLGLVYDGVFIGAAAFFCIAAFSVVLTPLGWTRNATMACITFAILCPVDVVLLYKSRRLWIWLTAFSGLAAFLSAAVADQMSLSRVEQARVFFAATGYVAASLLSKLLYKRLRKQEKHD